MYSSSALQDFQDNGDIHPIDIVENIAEHHSWEFERSDDDQITMIVESQWKITYPITLAWSAYDQTLRLICTFAMEPPTERLGELYDLLNLVNDKCWTGGFNWWADQELMVWRYGLVLAGDQFATPEQIDAIITGAVLHCERFYPAFQLVCWQEYTPIDALGMAIADACGHA